MAKELSEQMVGALQGAQTAPPGFAPPDPRPLPRLQPVPEDAGEEDPYGELHLDFFQSPSAQQRTSLQLRAPPPSPWDDEAAQSPSAI
eukprot:11660053-Alexandrium_andersonii.AAC.1